MAYIEKTDIATFLNITLTPAGEATLAQLIPAVEAFAESYCNRSWKVQGNQVEAFDGGGNVFLVAHPPINNVVSIMADGVAVAPDNYVTYGSYVRSTTILGRLPRSVIVTYTSKIALPADLKLALIRWVAELFKASEDAGKTTKRVTMGSVSVDYLVQDGIPAYVEMVLKKYRLHTI